MILEVKDMKKSFSGNAVLSDISFNASSGEILAVIGHSGAGKTTLLRCLNGLEYCDAGSIMIDNMYMCREENGKMVYAASDIMKKIRAKLGMVFQNYNLFPHMSVIENIIEAPVNAYNVPAIDAADRAKELLKMLGLADKADCYPYQLSGGQKQRAAIARACALSPSIMCFDEPTSALDPELKEGIAQIIEKLASDGMAILLISHDMSFVRRAADRLLFMDEGRILQQGTMDELSLNPEDERVKKFIQSA